jgi:hypothetical protein
MVAFSKYLLIGDLIITPILQAVEALPTELIGYIGGYVTPLKASRLVERYENIFGELQHIYKRTDANWAEYAKENLTRFGNKDTDKCYKTPQGRLYKKDNPDMIRSFNLTFKWRLDDQARGYIKRLNKQYNDLFGFYDRTKLKLGQTFTQLDGQAYIVQSISGKEYGKPDALCWRSIPRCVEYLRIGRCYCQRCDSS